MGSTIMDVRTEGGESIKCNNVRFTVLACPLWHYGHVNMFTEYFSNGGMSKTAVLRTPFMDSPYVGLLHYMYIHHASLFTIGVGKLEFMEHVYTILDQIFLLLACNSFFPVTYLLAKGSWTIIPRSVMIESPSVCSSCLLENEASQF